MINKSEEDWLTISGLPRLSSTGRSWQTDVRKQVRAALLEVVKTFQLRVRFEVLYVFNPIRQRLTGPTLLHVRLSSVEASKAIRDSFSGLFRHQQPVPKPPSLKHVTSIRNKLTLASRVRVEIMRALASNYQAKNPGSSFAVKNYDSRPSVVIVPPSSAQDPRTKTFYYMEAIQTLPTAFSDENLVAIFKVIGMKFVGQLSTTFVVLCDDDRERAFQLVKDQRDRPRGPGRGRGDQARVVSFAGSTSGLGSGVDLEANFLRSVRQPPPPPPPFQASTQVSPTTETPHRSERRQRSSTRSPSPSKKRSARRSSSRSQSPSSSKRRSARSPSGSHKRKRKSGSKHKKSRRYSSSSSSSGSGSSDSSSSVEVSKKKKSHK